MDESNPYQSPEDLADIEPPRGAPTAGARQYNAYTRGRAYVSFFLGLQAASFMLGGFHPVLAMFALGLGIPAFILARREIAEFPEAEQFGFIIWGRRTGKIGMIGGAIALAIWIIVAVIAAVVAVGSGPLRW